MEKYITQKIIKKNNVADIFAFIVKKSHTTRREIERETGFSWGTVSSVVSCLIEQGYVVEEKSETSSVGRTTNMLRISGNKYVCIGLDVNRTELRAEIIGLDSSLKKVITADFNAKSQQELLESSEELCRKAIEWCKNKYCVFSLGIAFQGIVDGKNGLSIRFPGIEQWQPYNVKKYFIDKFALPVYLAHDPKCALLGVLAEHQIKDCVLVRLDEGIGMAVSQDYKILDDMEKFELGNTLTILKTGDKVTLKECASMSGIAERGGIPFGEMMTNLLKYKEIILEGIDALALAIYNVAVLFRPQKLIFTGRAMENEIFVNLIRKKIVLTDTEVIINPNVSAAFGAAVESIRSAINSFAI